MDQFYLDKLLAQLKSGDVGTLDEIYNMVSGRLYHIALAILRDKDLAEDALQDTIIALYKGVKGYKSGSNPYGYIAKIAQNTAINIYKRERRKGADYTDPEDTIGICSADSPYQDMDNKDRVERLLSRLNGEEMRIMYLKYYSEMTVRDIAKVISKSKSAVGRLIITAETKLIQLIKEEKQ